MELNVIGNVRLGKIWKYDRTIFKLAFRCMCEETEEIYGNLNQDIGRDFRRCVS